jgi:glucuronate isomerase
MNETNNSVASLTDVILKEVVQPLPVIDVHTHINGQDPAAHDISEVIFYHYIVSEMEASGVSRVTLEAAKTVEEKVDLFLKSYKQLSNTITFWCLRRVLELHGVAIDTDLTREALLGANAKVQATHADPSWPRRTLEETNHVCKTALTLNITEKIPDFDAKTFFGTLRLDDLLGNVTAGTLSQFAATAGKTIDCLASFEKAAGDQVAAFAKGRGKALSLGLPPEEDFVPAGRAEAAKLFNRVLSGETLSPHELEFLHAYLLEFFAGLASDARLPVQLLLGVRRPLPGHAAVVILGPGLVSRYAALFHKFKELNFDLFLASVAHSQEAVATAKSYPNISLTGFWWYGFSPPYIRAMLTERLLALPMVKLHAFFSDAYNVEWSVGKLALLRRELSRVMAELVVFHYISESQAPELAKYLLHENATRLYKL